MVIEKVTYSSILRDVESGIAFDLAENHGGIVEWYGNRLTEYGFNLSQIDESDLFWESKMRAECKAIVRDMVKGKKYQYCIVEGVYGGVNFHTTRILLALNTVVSDLIMDGVFKVEKYSNKAQREWSAGLRKIYKPHGKLTSKVETQEILRSLEYNYCLENLDKNVPYYEDICDAAGMLISEVVVDKLEANKPSGSPLLKMKDVKVSYHNSLDDVRKSYGEYCIVNINTGRIEKNILEILNSDDSQVYVAEVGASQLGTFGIKNKLVYYSWETGYLVFCTKKKRQRLKEKEIIL